LELYRKIKSNEETGRKYFKSWKVKFYNRKSFKVLFSFPFESTRMNSKKVVGIQNIKTYLALMIEKLS
jgi:hypothetical protein